MVKLEVLNPTLALASTGNRWLSRTSNLIQLGLADCESSVTSRNCRETHQSTNSFCRGLGGDLGGRCLAHTFLFSLGATDGTPKLHKGCTVWRVGVWHTAAPGNDATHFLQRPLLDQQHISHRDQLFLASVYVGGLLLHHRSRLAIGPVFAFCNPRLKKFALFLSWIAQQNAIS